MENEDININTAATISSTSIETVTLSPTTASSSETDATQIMTPLPFSSAEQEHLVEQEGFEMWFQCCFGGVSALTTEIKERIAMLRAESNAHLWHFIRLYTETQSIQRVSLYLHSFCNTKTNTSLFSSDECDLLARNIPRITIYRYNEEEQISKNLPPWQYLFESHRDRQQPAADVNITHMEGENSNDDDIVECLCKRIVLVLEQLVLLFDNDKSSDKDKKMFYTLLQSDHHAICNYIYSKSKTNECEWEGAFDLLYQFISMPDETKQSGHVSICLEVWSDLLL